jgi:hypothetical protein
LRLGHPNSQTLNLALKLCNISFINTENDVSSFCTAYCMGKAHRLNFTSSQTIYFNPLELVLSDLCGLANVVKSGPVTPHSRRSRKKCRIKRLYYDMDSLIGPDCLIHTAQAHPSYVPLHYQASPPQHTPELASATPLQAQ